MKPRDDFVPLSKVFYSDVFDDEYSDVTIVVDDEPIRAHRIVLARRCKFFHVMFTSGMRESKEPMIRLPGISKSVFMLLLQYIYTDEVNLELANVVELYQAGDRFQLPKLQGVCAEVAEEQMTVEHAAIFLQRAHDLNCLELKEIAVSFVRSNFVDVSQTQGMNTMSAELMREIVAGFELVLPNKRQRS